MSEEAPSGTVLALAILQGVFHKYAGKEGNPESLTKKEAKELLNKEVPFFFEGKDKEAEKLLNDLDENGDNEMDFTEFTNLIAKLSLRFHDLLHKIEEMHRERGAKR